jgi:hypothetical protein
MLRAVRKGAMTNAGILAAIKSVWNGASTLALVPPAPAIPIPSRDEMRLPAQVGHPTNRPLVAPIPAARDVFVSSDFFSLNAKMLNATLKPTSKDTIVARMMLTGIINIKK